MTPADRALTWLVRANAAILLAAVAPVFFPTDLMAGLHDRLGLGELARGRLTEYLTRSAAACYALHGGVLALVSADVRRFRPLVAPLYRLHLAFAAAMLGIDLYAGMPVWWTTAEVGTIAGVAILALLLNRRASRAANEPASGPSKVVGEECAEGGTMIRTLSLAAVLTAAGTAAAQRPVPVVSPPILNPQVQQYVAPRVTRYVPPRYTPPAVGYSPWAGPVMFPGSYSPPRVVQSVPGSYLNVAGLGLYNPYTGAIYSPYTDTFNMGSNVYAFNPWTGTYTSPWTGQSYNPWRGTLSTPAWSAYWNPWGW